MTTTAIYTDQIQTGGANAVNLGAGFDAYVATGVHVISSAGYGIRGSGGGTITIGGDVFGDFPGINFTTSAQNIIFILGTGSVASNGTAIAELGNDTVITNDGVISGLNGISAWGNSPDVHNHGSILAASTGIGFNSVSGTNLVTNSGVIDAIVAIQGSGASDYAFNTGLITGTVILNAGDDLFDSRGGTMRGPVYLGDGNDTAFGSDGADSISGDGNDDRIRGKLGDDRLDGGLGKDILTGGHDEDEFFFSTTLGGGNIDVITDFVHGEDTILLSAMFFAELGPTVSKAEFLSRASGHVATKASHHLIYDQAKGTLWFDIDGKGGAGPVKFAQLGTSDDHPTNLNYHDFAII